MTRPPSQPLGQSTSGVMAASAVSMSRALNARYSDRSSSALVAWVIASPLSCGVKPVLVLAGSQAEGALEVAMKVALVGKAGSGRGGGDGLAGFEQPPGDTDAMGDLQCVRGQTGSLSEQADEAELADAGRVGQ